MPLIWRVIVAPMTLPGIRSFKELVMIRIFVCTFAQRSFTPNAAKVVDNLMLEDPNQPRSLRAAPFKLFISFQGCEESFLHGIFRSGIVAKAENGVLEKIIAVIVQPTTRIGRFIGELTLCRTHINEKLLDQ